MDEVIALLKSIDKNLSVVSKNLQALRSGEDIRNLAMSNFVTTQAELNECHAERIDELSNVAASIEAVGKLNIHKN